MLWYYPLRQMANWVHKMSSSEVPFQVLLDFVKCWAHYHFKVCRCNSEEPLKALLLRSRAMCVYSTSALLEKQKKKEGLLPKANITKTILGFPTIQTAVKKFWHNHYCSHNPFRHQLLRRTRSRDLQASNFAIFGLKIQIFEN